MKLLSAGNVQVVSNPALKVLNIKSKLSSMQSILREEYCPVFQLHTLCDKALVNTQGGYYC